MILARYFKNTWRGKQLGGKDLWFVFHRTLMVLTVLLSITAVVLVMVEVDIQPLAKANLSSTSWWSWTMMGYVIFHFLVHVILSFLMAREERSSKVRDTQLHVMSGKMVQEYEEIGDNEAGSGVRKLLGFVYAVIAWAVAAALIVAVFQA